MKIIKSLFLPHHWSTRGLTSTLTLLIILMTAIFWLILGGFFKSNACVISKFLHRTERESFISIIARCFPRHPRDPVQKGRYEKAAGLNPSFHRSGLNLWGSGQLVGSMCITYSLKWILITLFDILYGPIFPFLLVLREKYLVNTEQTQNHGVQCNNYYKRREY